MDGVWEINVGIPQGGVVSKGSSFNGGTFWRGQVNYPTPFANASKTVVIAEADFINMGLNDTTNAGEEIAVAGRWTTCFIFHFYCRNGSNSMSSKVSLAWFASGY